MIDPKACYVVICRESKVEGARRDQYALARQEFFTDLDDAIDYAGGINSSREPRVAKIVWPEKQK